MTSQRQDFLAAVSAVESFTGEDLTRRVASLGQVFTGSSAITARQLLGDSGVTHDILWAAYALKRIADRVNVLIHVIGILLCLPHLLEVDERVEYLLLGAGNAGKAFDLETNLRVAEFTFIHWRRKSNVIRENALFKDLYLLAEHPTTKRKLMYVL